MNTALVFALCIVALESWYGHHRDVIRKRTAVWHHWLALIEDIAEACGIFLFMSFHVSPDGPLRVCYSLRWLTIGVNLSFCHSSLSELSQLTRGQAQDRECGSQWDQAVCMKSGADRPHPLARWNACQSGCMLLEITDLSTVGFYPNCEGGLMEGSEGGWWAGVALEGIE